MLKDKRTLLELSREVLFAQSAYSDLSVVFQNAAKAIKRLREIVPGSQDVINSHPIAKAWAVTIIELTELPISRLRRLF